MLRPIGSIWLLFWQSAKDLVEHDGAEYAGCLAFLAILSIFPFAVFIVSILRYATSILDIGNVADLMTNLPIDIPAGMMDAIGSRFDEILHNPPSISLLTLAAVNIVWTSSSIIEGLRTVLNIAFRVTAPPHYLWRRFLSVLQFLLMSTVIVIFILLATFLSLAMDFITQTLKITNFKPNVGFTAILIILMMLYRLLPGKKCSISSIIVGSILVICCWGVSAKLLAFFLRHFSQLNVVYGGMASVILSLTFFYILALFFIYGAEFIYHVENRRLATFDK